MHHILFLCGQYLSFSCGPCVLQHLVDQAGLSDQFEIESAGTVGFTWFATDSRMQEVMRERYPRNR